MPVYSSYRSIVYRKKKVTNYVYNESNIVNLIFKKNLYYVDNDHYHIVLILKSSIFKTQCMIKKKLFYEMDNIQLLCFLLLLLLL